MRHNDAEGAKLAAFIHHRLNNRDFIELLARQIVYSLNEFVLGDV